MKNTKNAIRATLVAISLVLVLTLSASAVSAQSSTAVNIQVLESVGGTTDPAPGSYSYEPGNSYTFTAVADTGFVFDHWVITGDVPGGVTDQMLTVDDNPLTGDCGYGYTYQFQAVFTPESALSAQPATISVTYMAVIAAALVAVAVIVALAAFRAGKKAAK
jgi:hypothetical protein